MRLASIPDGFDCVRDSISAIVLDSISDKALDSTLDSVDEKSPLL